MIDYCPACGIENKDGAGSCAYCGGQLQTITPGYDPAPGEGHKLYTNLADHSILYLLREWKLLDGTSQLFFPVLLLFVFIKKLLHRPFLVPILNASTPRFRAVSQEDLSRFRLQKTNGPAMTYFKKKGYTHCLDLTCLHYNQTLIKRIFVNEDHTRVATIFINTASCKMQFVSLEGYTSGKKIIVLLSRQSLPVTLPGTILFQAMHGATPKSLEKAFEQTLKKNGEPLVSLSLPQYLRLHFKADRILIAQAMRQGFLLPQNAPGVKNSQNVSTCASHPMHQAVRACSQCGVLLCETCYTARGDATYCNHCFSSIIKAESQAVSNAALARPLTSPDGVGPRLDGGTFFAGLGARGLAKLIDLVSIVGVVAVIAYGLNRPLTVVAGAYAPGLFAIFVQLLATATIVFYFIIVTQRLSGGIGHRILGMRVIDKNGQAPSLISVSIRFVYHLLACLFIFPVVGYLSIPFRKKRRGWHDTLADTWVITRHPKKTWILGWLSLLIVGGAIGWVGWGYWQSSQGGLTPDIGLAPLWEIKSNGSSMAQIDIIRDNLVITADSGKLIALDMQSGTQRWLVDDSHHATIQTPPDKNNLPVIVSTETPYNTVLLRIDPKDGAVLWRHPTGMQNAQVIVNRQGVLIWNEAGMKWINADGAEVWHTASATPPNATVMINGDLFVARYDDAEAGNDSHLERKPTIETTCISLTDGGIKWQEAESTANAMQHPLGNGFSVSRYTDGTLSMMFLPERRNLWTLSGSTGPVLAAKQDHDASKTNAPLIYTDTKMIVGTDGSVGFDYPPHRGMPVVTDQWLILIAENTTRHPGKRADQMDLMVMDRFSGQPQITFSASRHERIAFISEDETTIILCAMNPPTGIFSNTFSSTLLVIDKHTRNLVEISIGDTFMPWGVQVKILDDGRLIFIATSAQMGTYLLPTATKE